MRCRGSIPTATENTRQKSSQPLAKENVELLKEFDFFTFLSVGDYQAGFAAPKDYHHRPDGRTGCVLHFTLPLAMPLLTRGTAVLEVDDPEYYVAFSLPSIEAVRLVDAPPACRLVVHPAQEPDAAAAATLAEIGPDVRDLPAGHAGARRGHREQRRDELRRTGAGARERGRCGFGDGGMPAMRRATSGATCGSRRADATTRPALTRRAGAAAATGRPTAVLATAIALDQLAAALDGLDRRAADRSSIAT